MRRDMNAVFLGPERPGLPHNEGMTLIRRHERRKSSIRVLLADVMNPHGIVTADNRRIERKPGLMWMPQVVSCGH